MIEPPVKKQSVVIERHLDYPPNQVWQALTKPALITKWLMANDFRLEVDHAFQLTADWGVVDCRVLEVEPMRRLSYTWQAQGVDTIVTWTLAAIDGGTLLRMEQAGFRPDQKQAIGGARGGWPQFFDKFEATLGQQTGVAP